MAEEYDDPVIQTWYLSSNHHFLQKSRPQSQKPSMESTSNTTSRFRFRDHNQETGDDYSSEAHTSADSSSPSGDENVEVELQSMTAKGIQHLCLELLELKHESDLDFQKSISANYSAFLAIFKEIEVLQCELFQLKYQASSQKKLVKEFIDGIALKLLSVETIELITKEPTQVQLSPPSILETHTENVCELLDTLLSEHRLDDALALLEMEGGYFQSFRLEQNFSSFELMSYNSMISAKRAMLCDQMTLVAKNPRISPPELKKALLQLSQLGDFNLVNQLLLEYYHSRIESGIHDLQSSREFLDIVYIQEVAKFVCSMISQAAKIRVSLNGGGETSKFSDLTEWASREIGAFATCFDKYVASISEMSGRLSAVVDAMQIAMSYCSLLESQKIVLQPSLVKYIRPRVEEVLWVHVKHFRQVISIFTSTGTWVLGRYFGPGIIMGRSCAIIDQQPDYLFLTNSARKFVTLFQSFTEDVLPLVALQMESSVLKGIMDLFTAYVLILENALSGDTNTRENGGSKVNFPQEPLQEVSILASLSTLVQFVSSMIKNIFDGIHELDFEIDNYLLSIQETYSRLRGSFIQEFVNNILSPNVEHQGVKESRISWYENSKIYDLVPSPTHLEFCLELKKLQKLAGDDYVDKDWLTDLLRELMESTFSWVSSKSEIWTINEEDFADHCTDFMQFILDAQFLVEIARFGGYLSDDIINAFLDIISRLETCFIASGFNPVRDLNDDGWPGNAAMKALEKLQEFEEKELLECENSDTLDRESLHADHGLINDMDTQISSVKVTLIEDDICLEKEGEISHAESRNEGYDDGDTRGQERGNQSNRVKLGMGVFWEEEKFSVLKEKKINEEQGP